MLPTVPPSATWSPDGRALIYIDTRSGVSNLLQHSIAGGAATPLTKFTSEQIFSYAISPDQRQVGLVRGRAGLDEYTDEAVNDPELRRVREATVATADAALTEDQAVVEAELTDGRTLRVFVEQSLGNINKPLSDRQLDEKFLAQAVRALPKSQAETSLALCWKVGELADVRELVKWSVVPA